MFPFKQLSSGDLLDAAPTRPIVHTFEFFRQDEIGSSTGWEVEMPYNAREDTNTLHNLLAYSLLGGLPVKLSFLP